MSEPRDFDFIPLKRAARYLVGKPRAALRLRRHEQLDKITVFVDSDFAGDPVSRESTTGSVAKGGNHTFKAGSTLQSLTALSVGEAEFYAVVKESQAGLSLRSIHANLGIQMKVEIRSDTSTANSLTDHLGAGPRTKHIIQDTSGHRNEINMEISLSKGYLQRKLCRCWNEASLCISTTTTLQICMIGILLTVEPTLHCLK